MKHCHFEANDEIVHQDDRSQIFAIIVSGVIKLTRVRPNGRQQIVGLLSASDCLGDVFSTSSGWNAVCVTDVRLCRFQRDQFEAVLDSNPALERILLQKVSEDLESARQWIALIANMNATERIATFLLWLRKKGQLHCPHDAQPSDNLVVNIPLMREEIAETLGLTRETVSRTLGQLEVNGAIGFINTRCIEIRDPVSLRRIAGTDGLI